MTEKRKETVDDVMCAWNDHRAAEIEKLDAQGGEAINVGNMSMVLLLTSVWMDRLFNAHLREGKPKPKQTRKPLVPKDLTPNGGPQKMD